MNIPTSRILLQKLIFYMSETGVPIKYHFEPHLYGPFSKQLRRDLDELVFWDELYTDGNKYSLGNGISIELSEEIKTKVEKGIDEFKKLVLDDFGFESMEKIGTVLYCIRALQENDLDINTDSVLDEFQIWKGNKYSRDDVLEIYERLCPIVC